MKWRDQWQLSFRNIFAAPVRSLLTVLGMSIGIGAILAVLTLGTAGRNQVRAEMTRLGIDRVWLTADRQEEPLMRGDGALLRRPNDILAAEYCKALVQQGSRLRPLVLPRGGDYHALDADAENPSATAVRALYPDGNWRALVPEAAAALYAGAERFTMAAGERAMLARLRGMARRDWEVVPYGSEGLWSAVYKAVQRESSVEAVITAAKSKRYVRTRLQRLLLCAYLGLTADELARPAEFVRVLALSARGGRLLRRIRETSSVLCLNAGAHAPAGAQAELETRCAGLSTLFSTGTNAPAAALVQKGRVYRRKI